MKDNKTKLAVVSIILIMAAAIAVLSNKGSDQEAEQTVQSQDLNDAEITE